MVLGNISIATLAALLHNYIDERAFSVSNVKLPFSKLGFKISTLSPAVTCQFEELETTG